jgi:LysR family hca operon transcriptional activator
MVFSHILPLLLRRSPETQLLLRTMNAPEAIEALLKREIQAGFLRGPIESEDLCSEIYMREQVVVMMPEGWEQARQERVAVASLASQPLISISEAIAPAVHHATDEIERRSGVRLTRGLCSESLMTSMNAVASGLGYCFFSEYVGGIVPKGVVTRHIDLDPAPTLDLLFAYRREEPSAALATLIALVHDHSPYSSATMPGPGGAPCSSPRSAGPA